MLLPTQLKFISEIDSQTGKVTAIATGSTEVKTTDMLKECDEAEAEQLAKEDFGAKVSNIHLAEKTDKSTSTPATWAIVIPSASSIRRASSRFSALTACR